MIAHKFCSTCGIQSFALGKNPKTGESMARHQRAGLGMASSRRTRFFIERLSPSPAGKMIYYILRLLYYI